MRAILEIAVKLEKRIRLGDSLAEIGRRVGLIDQELPDGYIAAIAAVNGFPVATRDTSPIEAAGVKVFNPWKAA